MGKYSGTLYIPPEKADIIQAVIDGKELYCLHIHDMTFSIKLEYFGDNIYDIDNEKDTVVANVSIIKLVNGRYRLQVIGYICNPITMREKLQCIKKYTEIYGEHSFIINNRDAVIRVYRR